MKQAVKAVREGDMGSGLPLKNHKTIGFSSNTGTDPLKNQKVTKPALKVGHHWYDSETPFKWPFAGGSMLVRLWWYLDRLSLH